MQSKQNDSSDGVGQVHWSFDFGNSKKHSYDRLVDATFTFDSLFSAREVVQGQKLDFFSFFTVKSSTLEGIITFYRMKISFHTL